MIDNKDLKNQDSGSLDTESASHPLCSAPAVSDDVISCENLISDPELCPSANESDDCQTVTCDEAADVVSECTESTLEEYNNFSDSSEEAGEIQNVSIFDLDVQEPLSEISDSTDTEIENDDTAISGGSFTEFEDSDQREHITADGLGDTATEAEADGAYDPEAELNKYRAEYNRIDSMDDSLAVVLPREKKFKYNPDRPRLIDTVFDFAELFIFSLVAVLIFTTFIFRHSVVDGGSMEDTLHEGEHLIISDLFYTPKRGDIIVCEDYSTTLRKPIVKRIIGIAGDHVKVDTMGRVTLNGEALPEPYYHIDGVVMTDTVDMIVPEGEIFIMGDHRNNSTDSREFGTVDTDSIVGKVLFRFYPFNKFGTVK